MNAEVGTQPRQSNERELLTAIGRPAFVPLHDALQRATFEVGILAGYRRLLPIATMTDRLTSRWDAVWSCKTTPNSPSLLKLFEAEVRQESAIKPEVLQALNLCRVFDFGIGLLETDGPGAVINPQALSLAHKLMSERVAYNGEAGIVRNIINLKDQSAIGNPFHPLQGRERENGMERLSALLGELDSSACLLQVGFVIGEIEAFGFFDYGNALLARAMLPILLAAIGLPPLFISHYVLENRATWRKSLSRITDHGDWLPWLSVYLSGIEQVARSSGLRLRRVVKLSADWLLTSGELRSDAHALRLLEHLPRHPVLSIALVKDLLGVSFQTANNAVRDLLQLGVLSEIDSAKRGRLFVAVSLYQLFEEME